MFAKHLDKRGVIISVIITAITLFFANRIAWAAVIYAEVSDLGFTFFDVYVQLDDIIIALNATTEHDMDLIIGYGLTLLAGFSTIKRTWNLSSGSYSMKKLK